MVYSNFAFTACGLAMGGSWADAEQRYAADLASLPSEKAKASFLYAKTFELVRRDPRPLLGILLENERLFFLEIGPWLHGLAFLDVPRIALASCLQVLLLLAIVRHLFRGRVPGESMFWLAGWTGILLSVPFIRDGGWRALAASWPFLAAFVSTGLAMPGVVHLSRSRRSMWDGSREVAAGCLVLLATGALAGPWITHAALSAPLDLEGCPVDNEKNTFLVVRRADLNLAVGVVDAVAAPVAGIPNVEFGRYVRILNENGMEDSGTLLDAPTRPFVLLCAYDRLAHWAYQLGAPAELLEGKSQWLWMRIEPWKKSRYYSRVVDFGSWEPCKESRRAP